MATAIVTGSSRGFGLALARALTKEGWNVVGDGRDRSSLEDAARALGPRFYPMPGDVTDAGHRRDLVTAADELGALALLVNNAGALGPSPLPLLREVDLGALVDLYVVNVLAPLALVQLCVRSLAANSGAILNITSDAAVEGYPGWGAYGSTKAALDLVSSVLAVEEPEIRTWAFDPGDMRTAMHQAAFPGEDISDRPLAERVVPTVLHVLATRPPSGRIRAEAVAEEMAR